MRHFRNFASVACVSLLLLGCVKPQPPPPGMLSQGMVDALIDTGFYSQVGISRIIGQHYSPAEERWTIYACYQFTLADNAQGSDCVDSFSALKLNNGTWIVAVTINDVYRWRAITMGPEPDQGAGPVAVRDE